MNVINFSAPDYSGIARRRENAISGMGNALTGLGNTIMQGASDYAASQQQKKQWDNLLEQQKVAEQHYQDNLKAQQEASAYQRIRDALADERYNTEQKRQQDVLDARNKAMMQNRQAFMGSYGMGGTQPASRNSPTSDQDMFGNFDLGYTPKDGSIQPQMSKFEGSVPQQGITPGQIDYSRFEQYGPAAAMAAQMFYNAPDYETQQQALQNLNSAIAMAEQKSEMDRSKMGSNLSTRVGSYLASQGLRSPQTLQGLTKKQIQDEQYISELEGYLGALNNLPEYAQNAETIQMMTELNNIIDSMRKKMNWAPRKRYNPSYGR